MLSSDIKRTKEYQELLKENEALKKQIENMQTNFNKLNEAVCKKVDEFEVLLEKKTQDNAASLGKYMSQWLNGPTVENGGKLVDD